MLVYIIGSVCESADCDIILPIIYTYIYLGISLFFKSPVKAFLKPLPYLIYFVLLIYIIGSLDYGYTGEISLSSGTTFTMPDTFASRFGSNLAYMISNGSILIVILLIFLGPIGIYKFFKSETLWGDIQEPEPKP